MIKSLERRKMTKRRYRFLPTEMVASEKQECFQGERSELGTGALLWKFIKETTTGLKSKTNHKIFVKPACGESCFRHYVMPSLLSGIWGPFPCFWQINIQAGVWFVCTRECERYIYHLALDVRVLNWNYIIDEVIRRSQYELEHQRKVYIKISLLNQCSA